MPRLTGPLVLIGPPGAGKSWCAEYMSRETGYSRIEVDLHQWPRLRAHPDIRAAELVAGEPGPGARRAYLVALRERLTAERGEAAARRILEEAKAGATIDLLARADEGTVIDFGAGHSIYEHLDLRERVRQALRPARVVLLRPCADLDAAVLILGARLAAQGRAVAAERLRGYLVHPSNHALAGAVVDTEGQTIAELCARLESPPRIAGPV